MRRSILFIALLSVMQPIMAQNLVRYELHISDTLVAYTGNVKHAIAVNGQIPMPTLVFTEGDTAEIVVFNHLKESTSLHWHGIFLPNREDGVPWLTQLPIAPGATYTYRFPVIQNGTHWYHSHSGLQEQIGMYGMVIFNKREGDPAFRKGIDDIPTLPVILSEWIDRKPEYVHHMLRSGTDWFAVGKGSTQSYFESIQAHAMGTKLENEWKRMTAMDVSDVYYDKVLSNGVEHLTWEVHAHRVRLRMANGGASTYFWVSYSGGQFEVVANDGNDVESVRVDRMLIAVSETYDIVLNVPHGNTYEVLIMSEDRTRTTSIFLGKGDTIRAFRWPRLQYFEGMDMMNDMMRMNGTMDDMGMRMSMQQMDMNAIMYGELETGMPMDTSHAMHAHHATGSSNIPITLNYAMLRSTAPTALPPDAPVRELKFTLTGNMSRYVWSMDGRVLSAEDKIRIQKGEIVRMIIYNGSMMRHPMHLHGHDFRVLNRQAEYAPLKNVLDIMPMETDTIEFLANVEGDWYFHCHILYHMMSGMGRIFTYADQAANPLIPDSKKALRKLYHDDKALHVMFNNDFATNGNDGMAMLQNTRWSMGAEWRLGYHDDHGYETEIHLGRYIGVMQWFMPFVGYDWRYRYIAEGEAETNLFGQVNTKDRRAYFSAGFMYTLPMLIELQAEVYQDGNVRLQLMREDIPISPRLRMQFMVNSDKEYMAGFSYLFTANLALTTHYDSDMGLGLGLRLSY